MWARASLTKFWSDFVRKRIYPLDNIQINMLNVPGTIFPPMSRKPSQVPSGLG